MVIAFPSCTALFRWDVCRMFARKNAQAMAYPLRGSILDAVRHHPARDILAAHRRLGNYPFAIGRSRLEPDDWGGDYFAPLATANSATVEIRVSAFLRQ